MSKYAESTAFNIPFSRERWLAELLIYFGVFGLNGFNISHTILSGQLCAVRGITLASVLLLGRNGKRWKEAAAGHSLSNSLTHASHQESAKLPLHCFCSSPYIQHHITWQKPLTARQGCSLPLKKEKGFAGKASPGPYSLLPPSLTVGCSANAGGPVRRAGQDRLRRHLPLPPTTLNLQERPLLSPHVSTRWHFKYSTHLIPWLRRQI